MGYALERAITKDQIEKGRRTYRGDKKFWDDALDTTVSRFWGGHRPHFLQHVFLAMRDHREVFFGGAAGGGKSDALLMGALQYMHIPGYSALILRRTYAQLGKADSIMFRAQQWLAKYPEIRWNEQKHQFLFPNGATLEFGHLQYDKDCWNYDGPAYQYVAFDELTQFTEYQYKFLFGRIRKPKRGLLSTVPLRVRGASNPGGIGHDWVKGRFVTKETSVAPFIPAKINDNPSLDGVSYRHMLAELPPILRKQREEGDWEVTPDGLIFMSEWFQECVDQAPTDCYRFRFWDLAATDKKDADYTVGALVAMDGRGDIYIEDIVRGQWNPGKVERIIQATTKMDGHGVKVRMEQEPGASGKLTIGNFARLLIGYDFKGIPSSGAKVTRWTPLASAANNGLVKIVNAPWNHDFISELVNVPEAGNDDQADAASGAFLQLANNRPVQVGVSRVRDRREQEIKDQDSQRQALEDREKVNA
jgi:predicted phage terminase large subunit-like protein